MDPEQRTTASGHMASRHHFAADAPVPPPSGSAPAIAPGGALPAIPGVDVAGLHAKYAAAQVTGVAPPRAKSVAATTLASNSTSGAPPPPTYSAIDNLKICMSCDGLGMKKTTYMYMERQVECAECGGNGMLKRGEWASAPGMGDDDGAEEHEDRGGVSCPNEEMRLQQHVVASVKQYLAASGADGVRLGLARFLERTRAYGAGGSRATVYYSQLAEQFGVERTKRLLPDLARLVKDDALRRALLKCRCSDLDLDCLAGLKDAAPPPPPRVDGGAAPEVAPDGAEAAAAVPPPAAVDERAEDSGAPVADAPPAAH